MIEHLRPPRPWRGPVVHAERDGPEYGHGTRRKPTKRRRPRHASLGAGGLRESVPRLLHGLSLAVAAGAGKKMPVT